MALMTLSAFLVLAMAVSATGAPAPRRASSAPCTPGTSTTGSGYWTLFGNSQWTGSGLLTSSRADASQAYGVTCGGASVYGQSLPTTDPHRVTSLSFDFNPNVTGVSGSSPRLIVCFSTGCNSNGSLAPTQWTAGTWTHVDAFTSGAWSSTGGSCPNTYSQTWAAVLACHPGASIVEIAVVNDAGSFYPSGEQVLLNNLDVNNVLAHANPPVFGQRATVAPSNGAVTAKRPGDRHFRPVNTVTSLPYGTLVNANSGRLQIIAAKGTNGQTESGDFYGGSFRLTQTGSGIVDASLTARPRGCATGDLAQTAAKPHQFHLWGHVKGKYRTRGAYGSASVRGTIWLTENRCDGTYFRVVRGTLWIRDFTRHRSIVLRAGHSYLAPSALPRPPRHTDHDGDHDGD